MTKSYGNSVYLALDEGDDFYMDIIGIREKMMFIRAKDTAVFIPVKESHHERLLDQTKHIVRELEELQQLKERKEEATVVSEMVHAMQDLCDEIADRRIDGYPVTVDWVLDQMMKLYDDFVEQKLDEEQKQEA